MRTNHQRDVVDGMVAQWQRERPDLDSAALEVVLRIPIAADQLAARLRECLGVHGLSLWEFDVLSALRRVGEPHALSPTELCEASRLTSGAMTNRIDRLEERGLVARRAGRSDRRSITVQLTARGRALIDQAIVSRVAAGASATAALSERERAQLARLLRLLVSSSKVT